MIHFKKGVKTYRETEEGIISLDPHILQALYVARDWYKILFSHLDFTVTSLMDGDHSENSLHYVGRAADIRTWADEVGTQMEDYVKQTLCNAIQRELGKDYDVVVETTHIHMEYDPK